MKLSLPNSNFTYPFHFHQDEPNNSNENASFPKSSLLYVLGQAGIGKSTLVKELLSTSTGNTVFIYDLSCKESPFAELVKNKDHLVGIHDINLENELLHLPCISNDCGAYVDILAEKVFLELFVLDKDAYSEEKPWINSISEEREIFHVVRKNYTHESVASLPNDVQRLENIINDFNTSSVGLISDNFKKSKISSILHTLKERKEMTKEKGEPYRGIRNIDIQDGGIYLFGSQYGKNSGNYPIRDDISFNLFIDRIFKFEDESYGKNRQGKTFIVIDESFHIQNIDAVSTEKIKKLIDIGVHFIVINHYLENNEIFKIISEKMPIQSISLLSLKINLQDIHIHHIESFLKSKYRGNHQNTLSEITKALKNYLKQDRNILKFIDFNESGVKTSSYVNWDYKKITSNNGKDEKIIASHYFNNHGCLEVLREFMSYKFNKCKLTNRAISNHINSSNDTFVSLVMRGQRKVPLDNYDTWAEALKCNKHESRLFEYYVNLEHSPRFILEKTNLFSNNNLRSLYWMISVMMPNTVDGYWKDAGLQCVRAIESYLDAYRAVFNKTSLVDLERSSLNLNMSNEPFYHKVGDDFDLTIKNISEIYDHPEKALISLVQRIHLTDCHQNNKTHSRGSLLSLDRIGQYISFPKDEIPFYGRQYQLSDLPKFIKRNETEKLLISYAVNPDFITYFLIAIENTAQFREKTCHLNAFLAANADFDFKVK